MQWAERIKSSLNPHKHLVFADLWQFKGLISKKLPEFEGSYKTIGGAITAA